MPTSLYMINQCFLNRLGKAMTEHSEKSVVPEKTTHSAKPKDDRAAEIDALKKVVEALSGLDRAAQSRVINYAMEMVGFKEALPSVIRAVPTSASAHGSAQVTTASPQHAPSSAVQDIRSLKEKKLPESAVEMAAIAAYYLSEAAPANERSDTITVEDLKRLFKQAGYPLPSKPQMTLVHSKNAGYLDSVSQGLYRLNPVGYNLVVHGLPADGTKKSKQKK